MYAVAQVRNHPSGSGKVNSSVPHKMIGDDVYAVAEVRNQPSGSGKENSSVPHKMIGDVEYAVADVRKQTAVFKQNRNNDKNLDDAQQSAIGNLSHCLFMAYCLNSYYFQIIKKMICIMTH